MYKNMYKRCLYAVIIAVVLGMTISCEKEDVEKKEFPPYFSTSPSWESSDEVTELHFKAEGETLEFRLTTSVAWEAAPNADWLTVTPNNGEYNATIRVTARRNESLANERTSTIDLIPEQGEKITISVSQSKMDYAISVDVTDISSSPFGQKGFINLTANTSWTATSNVDWVILNIIEGEGDKIVGYEVLENETSESRTAIVTFKNNNGDENIIITINQPEKVLFFPGSDFEDWDIFTLNNFIDPVHYPYFNELNFFSQSELGAGVDGGRAMILKGSIPPGSTVGTNPLMYHSMVQEYGSIEGKTKIVFYIKGTATRSLTFRLYKPNGNARYKFLLGSIDPSDTEVTIPISIGNSATESPANSQVGTIDTNGKWVKVILDISDLPHGVSSDVGQSFFAIRVGSATASQPYGYDLLIDNFSLE